MIDSLFFDLHWPNGETSTFRILGGPLDDAPGTKVIFGKIGYYIAALGRFETLLDIMLMQVNRPHNSSESLNLYDKNQPTRFMEKVSMLRKYAEAHPSFAPHAATVAQILDDLEWFADLRNELSHCIVEFFDMPKRAINTSSIRAETPRKARRARANTGLMKLSMLEQAAEAINERHRGLVLIFSKLASQGAFAPEDRL